MSNPKCMTRRKSPASVIFSSILLIVSLLFIKTDRAAADTPIGGPIISDTTWTSANSPYIVIANVQVLAGVTLTIEPGVVVRFDENKILQIDGQLIAKGTNSEKITLTSHMLSPQPGDWGQIYFSDSSIDATFDGFGNYISGSIMQYCDISYAGGGSDGIKGVIETNQASPYIDHCVIQSNATTGIRGVGTGINPIIASNNTIQTNNSSNEGGGMYVQFGVLDGNHIFGNSTTYDFEGGGGIDAYSSIITNNTITGNYAKAGGGGISAYDSEILNNTVSDNKSGNFDVANHYGHGAGIYALNSTITNNLISHNQAADWAQGGGLHVIASQVYSNTIIGNVSYYGGGIFSATQDGSGSSDIEFNILKENESETGGGGFVDGGIISGNTFIENSSSGWGSGLYLTCWVFCNPGQVLHNNIIGNYSSVSSSVVGGLAVLNTATVIQYNNLYGNSPYDVVVFASEDIAGQNNYWGTSENIDILSQIYDWYDDTSRGRFLYIPYLQDPDPSAPVPPPLNLHGDFEGDAVTLSWDPIPSTTTGYGYKIYYDNDSSGPPYDGVGLSEGTSPIDVGSATTKKLTGFDSGDFYTSVTAYDPHGRESWYSNEVDNKGLCPDITEWKGEYWNNEDLIGQPILCRNDTSVNFHWQSGSPDPLINVDHFSARWTRDMFFNSGTYRFTIYHDDGVRLYVDGATKFENWCGNCAQWDHAEITLGEGIHNIRMEIHENVGSASAFLDWAPTSFANNFIYLPVVEKKLP